ncbi:MAG: ATP-binding protein, partial [Prevotella sp.]|nr:ATP-binding protein [Prevotella sp.]
EVDILLIKQIELKYLTKIKKLFYLLAVNANKSPNISKLAIDIGTSRATAMNYIKYLTDARLLNIIYPRGEHFPKKPAKVMLHNSNLMYAIYPIQTTQHDVMETFFVNSMWKDHLVNKGDHSGEYIIDDKLRFRVCDALSTARQRFADDTVYARYNTEIGKGNHIPLWLFGFLY